MGISVGFATVFFAAIFLNILRQLLPKDPKKPPVVFHFVPVIGSTVTYGMDPYKFFFSNRQKVRFPPCICSRALG
ncbi:Lanosterol 14-alpha-demethylase [Diplodia seriata]|uniref:Lanosterol 14-alpha-demethylase n=1 Tax=Diplodia seriata TaxID=420778 RepID=A0ABR3CCI7_9PEZI